MKYYPSWRFHRTLPPCIVADPDADDALGEGWAMTPAAFLEPEPAATPPAATPGHALAPAAIAEHTIAVLLEEPPAKPHKPEADKCLKSKPTTTTKTQKRKHR
jgi:hypothetical protein